MCALNSMPNTYASVWLCLRGVENTSVQTVAESMNEGYLEIVRVGMSPSSVCLMHFVMNVL